MIKNQWYAVLSSKELRPNKPLGAKRLGVDLVFWRNHKDETNTRIYLRFYQAFVTMPVIKQIVNKISSISNKIILHQDRDVVLTQVPIKTDLKMGENLIQGDLPIIEFRKRRNLLKEKYLNNENTNTS